MGSERVERRRSDDGNRRRVLLVNPEEVDTPAQRALDRILRAGQATSALRLFLSRLSAPRPHHHRIARCLLDEAVRQCGGQIFSCTNGDLVLFASPSCVAELGISLTGLFRSEAASGEQLLNSWCLPEEGADARAALGGTGGGRPLLESSPAPLRALAAINGVLASPSWESLVRRQNAVRFHGRAMRVVYRELSVCLEALEMEAGVPIPTGSDPYLARYVSGQLDEKMLLTLAAADLSAVPSLTINLPLEHASSLGFVALRAAARRARTLLGVGLQMVDVAAHPALFTEIRNRLQADACTVVLDGVDHATLMLFDVAALGADLVKLRWSPMIPNLAARERRAIARAVAAIGAGRIVLCRAETERALLWGRSMGIGTFQGRHVDAMLAADRITVCDFARGCTLRQCIDRAAADVARGQAGCGNIPMLEGLLHRHPVG